MDSITHIRCFVMNLQDFKLSTDFCDMHYNLSTFPQKCELSLNLIALDLKLSFVQSLYTTSGNGWAFIAKTCTACKLNASELGISIK